MHCVNPLGSPELTEIICIQKEFWCSWDARREFDLQAVELYQIYHGPGQIWSLIDGQSSTQNKSILFLVQTDSNTILRNLCAKMEEQHSSPN